MLDITGKKFGRWTVTKFDKIRKKKSYWICKCKCGNLRSVIGGGLTSGHTKSCGCLKRELHTTHGMNNTREYETWHCMLQRCLNNNVPNYEDYGGRGIKVSPRWLKFENFYADMKKRPLKTSLDRLDNNKGYFKSNCAWHSAKKQARNRRNNINITYKGKTQCLKTWAEELEINYTTLQSRLQRYNWSVERAFNKM